MLGACWPFQILFYTLISVSGLYGIFPRDVSTKNETEVTHLGDVVHHRVKRWKVNFTLLSHYVFYLSIIHIIYQTLSNSSATLKRFSTCFINGHFTVKYSYQNSSARKLVVWRLPIVNFWPVNYYLITFSIFQYFTLSIKLFSHFEAILSPCQIWAPAITCHQVFFCFFFRDRKSRRTAKGKKLPRYTKTKDACRSQVILQSATKWVEALRPKLGYFTFY